MKNERLKKLCVYDARGDWVDIIRIHIIDCADGVKYIVRNVEEEDVYAFDDINSALEFIRKEYVDKPSLRIGECP
jgi:hypothetical protein